MDPQQHNSQDPKAVSDEEWQLVPNNWWHTPLSSTSWSYEPEKTPRGTVFAKPPHYHHSLYSKHACELPDEDEGGDEVLRTPSGWCTSFRCWVAGEDDVLNEDLVGVKGASDMMKAYEASIGFDFSPWQDLELEISKKRENLQDHVSQVDIELGRERWNELVEDLVGGKTLENLLKEEKRTKTSALGSQVVFLNSDLFSRPSTPKAFRLNPSASSFIPLGSPTFTSSSSSSSESSDRVVAFSFPSLNNSFPPLANSRDDHRGTNVSTSSRSRATSSASSHGIGGGDQPPASFLSSFLDTSGQRRRPNRTSRTRAIVDQLRSQNHQDVGRGLPSSQGSSPTAPEFDIGNLHLFAQGLALSEGCSSSSPSPAEEERNSGWPRVDGLYDAAGGWTFPSAPAAVDPETKKNRSKELFMALRRRTDSLSSSTNATVNLPMLGATSLGVGAASAPSVIPDNGSLTGSPEPVVTLVTDQVIEEETDDDQVGSAGTENICPLLPGAKLRPSTPSGSSGSSPCPSPNYMATHPQINAHAPSPRDARLQNHIYTHTRTKSTTPGGTKCLPAECITNPTTGAPYPFLPLPLSAPGVPLKIPAPVAMPAIPFPMTIMNPGVGPVPLHVPVQTMQYSTLMHLRIMQQMQMMRNSMGNVGLSAAGGGAGTATRMRVVAPSNIEMTR